MHYPIDFPSRTCIPPVSHYLRAVLRLGCTLHPKQIGSGRDPNLYLVAVMRHFRAP